MRHDTRLGRLERQGYPLPDEHWTNDEALGGTAGWHTWFHPTPDESIKVTLTTEELDQREAMLAARGGRVFRISIGASPPRDDLTEVH